MRKIAYRQFKKFPAYKIFKKYSLNILKETIANFFSCSLTVILSPEKEFLEKYNINIHDNIKRGFYPIDGANVLILARMFEDKKLISSIGFHLSGVDVDKQKKILNIFENILTSYFTQELPKFFQNSSLLFGDEIIKETISEYLSKGHYDGRQIRHLIDYFFKLRTTSFEGEYFSTGAILTKSRDISEGKRFGTVRKLTKPFFISNTDKIDKRTWYLVDGETSFFLGNKNLAFNSIFTLDDQYAKSNFLDTHALTLTLRGGDFLIKVENEKLLSITSADGSEFLFFENQWKYRNYSVLKKLLKDSISKDDALINSVLFYILSCAKKQHSTILWFPDDPGDIDQYINQKTKNSFLKENINIMDKQAVNHIFRCISSDGATVIDKNGQLLYIGVIINIEKAKVSGMTGTGESAASILSANGISIKISSDGIIKIFTKESSKPYYF